MAKLTIVITIYNKEPYLHKAFDALLNQTGTTDGDYEVLAVNDGSTDNSASIIEEYAERDPRVRVLTQNNQGLSMARNNGADAAEGEYVWFVDADDIYSQKSVYLICKAIESKPDIIPIYAKTDGIGKVRNAIPISVSTGKDVLLCGSWQQCGVFWIFRREFLKENNLRFMPGVYHEDAEFTPRMLYSAKTVKVVPEILYTVYRDPDGITQVPRPKRAFDYLIVAESLSNYVIEKNEVGTRIGKAIDDYTAVNINNALFIICQNNKEEQKRFCDVFFCKRKTLLRVLGHANRFKYRLEFVLFKLLPRQYVLVYRFLNVFKLNNVNE